MEGSGSFLIMITSEPEDVRPCRVVGLTSTKGQKLNGSSAKAPYDPDVAVGGRIPVLIDGNPGGPLSLKRTNVQFVKRSAYKGSIGVGRSTIRGKSFGATAVDDGRHKVVLQQQITGGSCRARGNLMAAIAHLKANNGRALHLTCTDLNVTRGFCRVIAGQEAGLGGSCHDLFQTAARLLKKEMSVGADIHATFEPHRISPDGFSDNERFGKARCHAVMSGACKIYPCPYKKYWDAMEVRFVDDTKEKIIVCHETYLDYGLEESESYVVNASKLGECDRIFPRVLAEVDPQAFWGIVLHIGSVMNTIKKTQRKDLIEQWEQVTVGLKTSNRTWMEHAKDFPVKLPNSIVAGTATSDWGISTDKDHEKIAEACQSAAFFMMLDLATETQTRDKKELTIRTIEWYKGGYTDKYIEALSAAQARTRKNEAKGLTVSLEDRSRYLNLELQRQGFGDLVDRSDPLSSCVHCGKIATKLQICGKCGGAAFCNSDCLKLGWKKHKKECSPFLAKGRRIMRQTETTTGVSIKSVMYTPRSSLPTTPGLFSEVSFTGGVIVTWLPGGMSMVSFHEISDEFCKETTDVWKLEAAVQTHAIPPSQSIPFERVEQLPPKIRFLLCCGPLSDINLARSAFDEIISGNPQEDFSNLRMDAVGFTALEWASKKGNSEIARWLCTEPRTMELISVGSPFGWACYTGRIDIAKMLVSFGVDSTKTDETLWGNTPPLLVAAHNGRLEVMNYLVDDLGHDIFVVDPFGNDIIKCIKCAHDWRSIEGRKEVHDWAKKKMKKISKS